METVISHVITGLEGRGVEARLFLLGGSLDESWLSSELNHVVIGGSSERRISRYVKYLVVLPYQLARFSPDVILGADERAVFVGDVLRRILRPRAPVGSWVHFSLTALSHRLLKRADFHIAISLRASEQFQELGVAPASKVTLIYNPVRPATRLIPRPGGTEAHFLYVGRLIYGGQKRTNDLFAALAKVQGAWKLSILGDGEDRAKLLELAVDLGIASNISWLGWRENPWEEIGEASALVLTSDFEGLGMVLVEAMSFGIPCISSDCPTGPAEIVVDGENGWLYPPRDIDRLAGLLQTVVDDPEVLPSPSSVSGSIAKFESTTVINTFIRTLSSAANRMN